MCADLARPGRGRPVGLDLPAVAAGLAAAMGGVRVEVVPGLCRHPARLDALAAQAGPGGVVVAGVCSTRPPGWATDRVEVVSLATSLAVTRDGPVQTGAGIAQLAGAVARAWARARPEDSGALGGRLTRAPATRRDRRWLLSAGLLARGDDTPRLAEVAAQLDTLARLAPPGSRVVLACQTALETLEEACAAVSPPPTVPRMPVVLPCRAVLTPGWVLQPLAAGAGGVDVLRCPDCDSSGGAPPEAVRCAEAFLQTCGLDPDHRAVTTLPAHLPELAEALVSPADGWTAPEATAGPFTTEPAPCTLEEPQATVAASLRLTAGLMDPPPALVDLASPVGVVRVRDSACTLCGACTRSCPHDALSVESVESVGFGQSAEPGEAAGPTAGTAGTALTVQADRCRACGACVAACPQQALSVRPAVDVTALRAGRIMLARAQGGRCRGCGRPLAPDPLLDQVRHRLAGRHPGWAGELAELCPTCQQARAVASVGALP